MKRIITIVIQNTMQQQDGTVPSVTESGSYVLAATTAPPAYDGFGTFTVKDELDVVGDKPLRVVLIREEHLRWQFSRYSSGLFAYAATKHRFDSFDPEYFDIMPLLWTRLQGESA